jgi:hypothetical protein
MGVASEYQLHIMPEPAGWKDSVGVVQHQGTGLAWCRVFLLQLPV